MQIKKMDHTKHHAGCEADGTRLHSGHCTQPNSAIPLGNWQFLKKLNASLSYDPSVPLLKTCAYTKTCM